MSDSIVYTKETDINKYRLTSLEEPTDEMLQQIMREAAEEVRIRSGNANKLFMEHLSNEVRKSRLSIQ